MSDFFDFETVLDAEFDKDIFPIEVLDERFLVRRMTGAEYANFQADNNKYGLTASLITAVLATNVYYNEPKPIPIKNTKAERLLKARYDLALALVIEIVNLTRDYTDGLAKSKEDAAKN